MHDESVTSVGIELEGSLDMNYVNMWLSKLLTEQGVDLFRSKGILAIKGSNDKYAINLCLKSCCDAQSHLQSGFLCVHLLAQLPADLHV